MKIFGHILSGRKGVREGHLLRDEAKGLQYEHSGGRERGAFIIYRKRPVISPSLFRGSTMEIQLALGNVFHILFCAGTFPLPITYS